MALQHRNEPLATRKALKSSSPKTKDCSCQVILPQPFFMPIKEKSGLKDSLELPAIRSLSQQTCTQPEPLLMK